MKKITFLALAMLFLVIACQKRGVKEYSGSFADVKAQSASLNKPILMEFFADW